MMTELGNVSSSSLAAAAAAVCSDPHPCQSLEGSAASDDVELLVWLMATTGAPDWTSPPRQTLKMTSQLAVTSHEVATYFEPVLLSYNPFHARSLAK